MLDRYGLALLRELQADARLSKAALAGRIGLSAAPTWRRVKRLEAKGYIAGGLVQPGVALAPRSVVSYRLRSPPAQMSMPTPDAPHEPPRPCRLAADH